MRETDHPSSQPAFDPLREALHTEACPTTDLAFGSGQRYKLAGGHAVLEVFPDRQLSRITTPTSRLELFASPAPQVIDGQVVLSRERGHEDTTLSVSPEGTVVFSYVSTAQATSNGTSNVPTAFDGGGTSNVPVASDCDVAPEQPVTAPQTAQEPAAIPPAGCDDGPAAADTSPTAPLRPPIPQQQPRQTWQQHPESVAADRAPVRTTRPDHPAEQQPRVQLTGRLGRDPNFRTSPRGTFIGRFPLAVHREDGSTTWHTILAFGDRAKQLQHRFDAGELSKGQEVTLIGYPHTREQPTRDGGRKTVTEIYAVAVTRR